MGRWSASRNWRHPSIPRSSGSQGRMLPNTCGNCRCFAFAALETPKQTKEAAMDHWKVPFLRRNSCKRPCINKTGGHKKPNKKNSKILCVKNKLVHFSRSHKASHHQAKGFGRFWATTTTAVARHAREDCGKVVKSVGSLSGHARCV